MLYLDVRSYCSTGVRNTVARAMFEVNRKRQISVPIFVYNHNFISCWYYHIDYNILSRLSKVSICTLTLCL